MIRRILRKPRLFRKSEKGSATIEFIMIFPIFLWLTYSGVEIGILTFNHAHLERALDQTIRDVRLNNIEPYTSNPEEGWTHDMLKDIVCDKAVFIPECSANLRLEMTKIDPFDSAGNPFAQNEAGNNELAEALCVDTPEEIRTTEVFEPGGSNELMIVRACVELDILWMNFSALGQMAKLVNDTDGQYELHATTVFVNEPA